MKVIIKYRLPNGKIPFDDWFSRIDKSKQAKVLVRIERLKLGLYGQMRNLKKGICELKFSSGERIYIYEKNEIIILLLTAGNKQRQTKDIENAEKYLLDYIERCNNDK